MAKRKVFYVQLHDGFFLPGAGEFKKTLPPDNKTFKDLEMTYVEETGAVLMKWAAGSRIGSTVIPAGEYAIGAANVKIVGLVPEEKAVEPKAPAKKTEPSKAS